jgi:hypothetical protein
MSEQLLSDLIKRIASSGDPRAADLLSIVARELSSNPHELLGLSRPEKHGLPFKRRVLGRRIAAGNFPPVVRINGRLFVTRANLEHLKAVLASGEEYHRDGPAYVGVKQPRVREGAQ